MCLCLYVRAREREREREDEDGVILNGRERVVVLVSFSIRLESTFILERATINSKSVGGNHYNGRTKLSFCAFNFGLIYVKNLRHTYIGMYVYMPRCALL